MIKQREKDLHFSWHCRPKEREGGESAELISTIGRRAFNLSRRAKGRERDLGVPSLGEEGVVEEPPVKPYCTNSKRGRVEQKAKRKRGGPVHTPWSTPEEKKGPKAVSE